MYLLCEPQETDITVNSNKTSIFMVSYVFRALYGDVSDSRLIHFKFLRLQNISAFSHHYSPLP